jgi:hypothetical protein
LCGQPGGKGIETSSHQGRQNCGKR